MAAGAVGQAAAAVAVAERRRQTGGTASAPTRTRAASAARLAGVSLEAVVQGRLPAVHYSERVPGCSQTAYVLVYHARR